MSHFAEIDENNIVLRVIVAEQDFIDSGSVGDPKRWIQTSYNTLLGKHPQGRPLRKNYAVPGFSYDPIRDAFIPPQPFDSWTLNEETCGWEPPVPFPDDGKAYAWKEELQQWELIQDHMG